MKKILISLLCIIMVVCFMPAMAFADSSSTQTEDFILKVLNNDGSAKYYDSLAEASQNISDGDTMVVLKSFETTGGITVDNKSIILDLNGKTVTRTNEGSLVRVNNGGGVKITDSSSDNTGKLVGQEGVLWIEGGKIELSEGTVKCAGYWEYPQGSGTPLG